MTTVTELTREQAATDRELLLEHVGAAYGHWQNLAARASDVALSDGHTAASTLVWALGEAERRFDSLLEDAYPHDDATERPAAWHGETDSIARAPLDRRAIRAGAVCNRTELGACLCAVCDSPLVWDAYDGHTLAAECCSRRYRARALAYAVEVLR